MDPISPLGRGKELAGRSVRWRALTGRSVRWRALTIPTGIEPENKI